MLDSNSARRQIACKRGSGKLRHVSGRLLWVKDKVAEGIMEVRQVGTTHNLADVGTKPLGKNRLQLLLHWCNARTGGGERVGLQEAENYKAQAVEKGKITEVAKYLHQLVLVGALELASGERVQTELEQVRWASCGGCCFCS